MADLRAIMAALQALGDAVTNDDEQEFRRAAQRARQLGCSERQIRDAYDYRNNNRWRRVDWRYSDDEGAASPMRYIVQESGEDFAVIDTETGEVATDPNGNLMLYPTRDLAAQMAESKEWGSQERS